MDTGDWDGQERRSGKEKRKTERRGVLSQVVTAVVGSTNQRKRVRRATDRIKVVSTVEKPNSDLLDSKWREIRLRTVGTLAEKPKIEKPKLRLVRGGNKD